MELCLFRKKLRLANRNFIKHDHKDEKFGCAPQEKDAQALMRNQSRNGFWRKYWRSWCPVAWTSNSTASPDSTSNWILFRLSKSLQTRSLGLVRQGKGTDKEKVPRTRKRYRGPLIATWQQNANDWASRCTQKSAVPLCSGLLPAHVRKLRPLFCPLACHGPLTPNERPFPVLYWKHMKLRLAR